MRPVRANPDRGQRAAGRCHRRSAPAAGGGPGAATTNEYLAQVSGAGMGYSPNGNTTATTTTTAGSGSSYRAGSLPRPRKDSTTNFDPAAWGQSSRPPTSAAGGGGDLEMVVILRRHDSGFGFRIVGGTEEGSQVNILTFLIISNLYLKI